MADNTTFSPGSGATLATDEITSVHHVYNKMEWGADGTATPVASGGSALPIQDGGNSITVDNGGTFAVQAVCTNAGTFATQAVCTNAGTFAVQAAQSGTWNITNVSGTVSLPTGAATAAKQPALGTAGTASTDVITIQGISGATAVKVDGSAVTQPVSGTVAFSNTTLAVTNAGTFATQAVCTNAGTFAVQATLQSGTNGIGKLTSNTGVTIGAVELAASQTLATVTTVGTVTTITNAVTANLAPTTTGGCTMSSTLSSATANTATSVKGSAGQLYGIYVSNTNAAARWLKLYNTGSTPTGGSGTPVLRLLIPGNTSGVAGAFEFSNGVAFSSGIGFTITGAVADSDTTAISANEVIVNILYK